MRVKWLLKPALSQQIKLTFNGDSRMEQDQTGVGATPAATARIIKGGEYV
jgi:hypothetical protein